MSNMQRVLTPRESRELAAAMKAHWADEEVRAEMNRTGCGWQRAQHNVRKRRLNRLAQEVGVAR